ncbi:hypothetical protein BJY00DRAFT_284621 [Aspergillus carlsbadensis]|nr:hypothetical protein BJY00DRAFT_284621 [Aspergillus carlsbadensis]
MNDPYLSAWTTQYTNSPLAATMSSTFEKTRPRRKARRSCMNCQRGHRTCDNQRPCEQCTKRGKQKTCVDGTHKQFKYLRDSEYRPTRRSRSGDGTEDSSEGSSPECIDPGLLHAQPGPNPTPAQSDTAPGRGLGEKRSIGSSLEKSLCGSPQSVPSRFPRPSSNNTHSQTPDDDIFEDILAELLAYDTTKPHPFNVVKPQEHEHESKSNGFSISTGWSNTFFPPGFEDHDRAWNVVAGGTECGIRLP